MYYIYTGYIYIYICTYSFSVGLHHPFVRHPGAAHQLFLHHPNIGLGVHAIRFLDEPKEYPEAIEFEMITWKHLVASWMFMADFPKKASRGA